MENNQETFTYVITNVNSTTDATYAQWNMRLNGLPTRKKFYCKVIDFVINHASLSAGISSYVTLACNNLGDNIINNYGFSPLCSVSTDATVCQLFSGNGSQFICDNFNYKTIEFFLVEPDLTKVLVTDINDTPNTYWALTLLVTPIDE